MGLNINGGSELVEKEIDVSVIVATYNSDIEKLYRTIRSIMYQKNVDFEIIITDDGSKDTSYLKEIELYFKTNGVIYYQIISNKYNVGNCNNYYNATVLAKGKYIKYISPGDCLFSETVLSDWIEFMNKFQIKISFGKYVPYNLKNDVLKISNDRLCPKNLSVFKNNNIEKKKVDYIVLHDYINGACLLVEKAILIEYLSQIVKHIKYSEDLVYRYMLIDGVDIVFYNENVIIYETNTGISSGKNTKWINILKKEEECFNELLLSLPFYGNKFAKKFKTNILLRKKNRYFSYIHRSIAWPKSIFLWISRILSPCMTDDYIDTEFWGKIK